jgi:hypothetical protein
MQLLAGQTSLEPRPHRESEAGRHPFVSQNIQRRRQPIRERARLGWRHSTCSTGQSAEAGCPLPASRRLLFTLEGRSQLLQPSDRSQ